MPRPKPPVSSAAKGSESLNTAPAGSPTHVLRRTLVGRVFGRARTDADAALDRIEASLKGEYRESPEGLSKSSAHSTKVAVDEEHLT